MRQEYYFFQSECFPKHEIAQHNATNWGEVVYHAYNGDLDPLGGHKVYDVSYSALDGSERDWKDIPLADSIVENHLRVFVHHAYHNERRVG